MSNYLSNLIARTSGTASVVQPRPLSLYEPIGHAYQTQVLHETQEIAGEDWPVQSSTPVAPLQSPTPRARRAPPPPIAPSSAELPLPLAETATVRPASLPELPLPPVERPAPVRPTILTEEMVKPAATVSGPRRPKPVMAGDKPDTIEQKHPDTPKSVFGPLFMKRLVAREMVTAQTDTRMMPAPTDRSAVQPVFQLIMVPAPTRPAPATPLADQPTFVPQPHIPDLPRLENKVGISASTNPRPALEKASQLPAPPSRPITATVVTTALPEIGPGDRRPPEGEAQPRPTIQVHIGRIEVRATPAKPPAQKQQRKPPVMGLDDYLQQRNGKGTTG